MFPNYKHILQYSQTCVELRKESLSGNKWASYCTYICF
ncbi:hypothetical protein BRADI_2g35334v3 [Brachypodium distachyon]|uniref:Uncharacterized protein n=1 Tax=Brachypodium distachyon TaxID=15368 RepID=A0A2K2DBY3_BRADI|nr:hypothetical protein BRADI_2g35334v3 [Brachypodium distachyon]